MDSVTPSTPSSAPAPSAPASSPAPSSTSTPTAPSSGQTSTAPTPKSTKPATSRELLDRKVKEAQAKEAGATKPIATASEIADKPVGEEVEAKTVGSEASEDPGLPDKLPDLKPGEYPEIPRDIRQALNAIQDKKVREQVARLTFVGKGFTELRMTPSEGARLREMYPTLQVAEQAHQAASTAYDLANAFHSGSPEGLDHFIGNLSQANPQAFGALVDRLTENLAQSNKQAFRRVANGGLKNLLANMRSRAEVAERNGDSARAHEYATAAVIMEEFAFPQGVSARPQGRPENDPAQQRIRELEARESAFMQQQQQAAFRSVTEGVEAELTKQTERFIAEADPDKLYPQKGRDSLQKKIVEGVKAQVRNNEHVGVTLSQLLQQGNVQGAQEFLLNQARNHLTAVAQKALEDYAEEFGAIQQSRQAKIAQVVQMKDVGSAGAALPKANNKPIDTRGMSTKERIEALVKAKLARTG